MNTNRTGAFPPGRDPDGTDGEAFLRSLARHEFRAPPPAWRAEILAPARATAGADGNSPARATTSVPWRTWWDRLASGWTLAAAAWALILALEQFSESSGSSGPGLRAPLSSEAVAILREQRQELLGQWAAVAPFEALPTPPPAAGERPRAAWPERRTPPLAAAAPGTGKRGWARMELTNQLHGGQV